MAGLFGAAWGQNINPGLWEITSKIGGNPKVEAQAAQMQELVANMNPADRKMVEDMLAQQGIRVGTGSDAGAMVVQTCITPDMAARNQLLVGNAVTAPAKLRAASPAA